MHARTICFPEPQPTHTRSTTDVNAPLTWANTTYASLRGWFAEGPLTCVDIHTNRVLQVVTGSELPPLDPGIEFEALFVGDTPELVGRLVPARMSGTEGGPSAAAFGDHPFAEALFLARYMPFSLAQALCAAGHAVVLNAVVRDYAGLGLVGGFFDGQGLRQALCDFPNGSSHEHAQVFTANTPLWFAQFAQQVRAIGTECMERNIHHVTPTDATAGLLSAIVKLIPGAEPSGDTVCMWTQISNDALPAILDYYATHARVGGATSSLATALLSYDLVVWHADENAHTELAGMNVAGWFTQPRGLGLNASDLASSVARKMASCLPVAVLAAVDTWSPAALVATLAALMHMAPRSQSSPGIFTATGSAAPIKLVLLSDSAAFVRRAEFARFAPQHKSA